MNGFGGQAFRRLIGFICTENRLIKCEKMVGGACLNLCFCDETCPKNSNLKKKL